MNPAPSHVKLVGFDEHGRKVFEAPRAKVAFGRNVTHGHPFWGGAHDGHRYHPGLITSSSIHINGDLLVDPDAGFAIRQFRYPEGPPVPDKPKTRTFNIHLSEFESISVDGHEATVELVGDGDLPVLSIRKNGKPVAQFLKFVGYARA